MLYTNCSVFERRLQKCWRTHAALKSKICSWILLCYCSTWPL